MHKIELFVFPPFSIVFWNDFAQQIEAKNMGQRVTPFYAYIVLNDIKFPD